MREKVWGTIGTRDQAKRSILYKGGFGAASIYTGIGYTRVSRIINGWIIPSTEEVAAIEAFINASDSEINKKIAIFRGESKLKTCYRKKEQA